MPASLVGKCLTGKVSLPSAVEAHALVCGMESGQVQKATALAREVHAQAQLQGLRPFTRTCYQRSAFQLTDTNDVRITLDTNLIFVDESGHTATEERWCLDLSSEIADKQIRDFPFAILEVKLSAGYTPDWVEVMTYA